MACIKSEATVSIYTRAVRPLLFRLAPERAQRLAETILGAGPLWRAIARLEDRKLHTAIAGIRLPNPIGLAAGYDKDCRSLQRLSNLGFGYLVGGTVTAERRFGNPRPRLVRNPSAGSLVNSLGLPSSGADVVGRNLNRARGVATPRIVSIAGVTEGEFLDCYRKLNSLCVGIELNISCPNTYGARVFQDSNRLLDLLSEIGPLKKGPLFIKLPPYPAGAGRDAVMKLVDACLDQGVEGVTVANTHPVSEERLHEKKGGLSGRPLLPHTLRMVREIRSRAGNDLVINGCGGISSGEDALQVLQAGANTLQIYTGFIYGGPRTIKRINRYLLDHMDREGMSSLSELTGRASG